MNEELYRQWIATPDLNPLTGRKIKIDGPTYLKYKTACERLGLYNNTPPVKEPEPLSKEAYLGKLKEISFNMCDPISLEEFEDLSAEQLSTIVLFGESGDGKKKHAFLPETISTWFNNGNTTHPVTNVKLDRAAISTILETTRKKTGNKLPPYKMEIHHHDNGFIDVTISRTGPTASSRSRVNFLFREDIGDGLGEGYTSAVALVLLLELSEKRIMPRKFYGGRNAFAKYVDYLKALNSRN